jgi:hypothetical protein
MILVDRRKSGTKPALLRGRRGARKVAFKLMADPERKSVTTKSQSDLGT